MAQVATTAAMATASPNGRGPSAAVAHPANPRTGPDGPPGPGGGGGGGGGGGAQGPVSGIPAQRAKSQRAFVTQMRMVSSMGPP